MLPKIQLDPPPPLITRAELAIVLVCVAGWVTALLMTGGAP